MALRRERGVLAELEELYERRYTAFLHVAVAMLGERELARDAVQEAFARAVDARRSYRGGSLEAWVWRILANHCRDLLRRQDLREHSPVATAADNGRPAELAHVRAALAALPERQRLMLFLRHYADLDYDAIAEITGVARGTVAATLHAARAALRERLEGEVR